MDDKELDKLKDRISFDLDMSDKSKEEIREEMYAELASKLKDWQLRDILGDRLDEAQGMLETTLELEEYIERNGLKKAED